MTVLIVEDEHLARKMLLQYLKNAEVSNVIETDNGFDAVRLINEKKPDIVLLDIHLPKLTGLEVLELIEFKPAIIFTTAYDQYAIEAFEKNAIDYLLKPFDESRLKQAIEKAMTVANGQHHVALTEQALVGPIERIVVRTGNKIKVIFTDEIQYLEAQDDYVAIVLDGKRYLKNKTMKFFEKNLPSKDFVRVHRSYIVNANCIDQIEQYEKDQYIIAIKSNPSVKIPVSKSGYNKLRTTLHF